MKNNKIKTTNIMDEMKDKDNPLLSDEEKEGLPGYPGYPTGEDIFKQDKEESDVDPEDISKKKEPVEKNKSGKTKRILKKINPAVTWMFPDQNLMTNRKKPGMKMKKIIIIVLAEMTTMIWVRKYV